MEQEAQKVRCSRRVVDSFECVGVASQRVWLTILVARWFPRKTWALLSTLATLPGLTACRETVLVAPTLLIPS
jgi:hypothetical protein